MEVNFEMLAEKSGMRIFKIVENGVILGKGIYIPKALTSFKNDEKSTISFSDTGVFVLFQGSNAFSKACKEKVKQKFMKFENFIQVEKQAPQKDRRRTPA